MRIRIGHRYYDTSISEMVGESENKSNNKTIYEALYRKQKTLEFFLYTKTTQINKKAEEVITPFSYSQAKEWADKHLSSSVVNIYFVNEENEDILTGEKTDIHLRLANIDKVYEQKLNRIKSLTGKTYAEIFMKFLDEYDLDNEPIEKHPNDEYIGERNIANNKLEMEIIEFRNFYDIDVIFLKDNYIARHKTYTNFKKGAIGHPKYQAKSEKLKKERIGQVGINRDGERMKIIDYRSAIDIDVEFVGDGTVVKHRTYDAFKKQSIANPNSQEKK